MIADSLAPLRDELSDCVVTSSNYAANESAQLLLASKAMVDLLNLARMAGPDCCNDCLVAFLEGYDIHPAVVTALFPNLDGPS